MELQNKPENNYDNMKKQTIEHFSKLHDEFTKMFKHDYFYIAGGTIRDFVQDFSDPKDYDIFVTCDYSFFVITEQLEKEGYEASLVRENSTVYSKSGELDFDIIKVELGLDREPMDGFDLTCCTAQFGPDGFKHHVDFFKDIENKEIKLNKLKLPYYTYKRIAKHIRKGYTVEDNVLRKVMDFAVEEMNKESTEAPVSNDPASEISSV